MVTDQRGKLENKVVIVTGAGSGIGRAIAIMFAEQGASVVVADIIRDKADETVRLIRQTGGSGIAIQADVSQKTAVENLVTEASQYYQHIDILVNNVALPVGTNILNIEEDIWDAVISTTLKSVYLCCKAVLPGMIAQKHGSIVNIASVNALAALGTMSYSAAKAGVINLTKNLSVTYGRHNIRVNVICPGAVRTPLWEKRIKVNPTFFEKLARWYPLGRVGEPEDIAKAALFLASPDADWITGATLVVDGGLTVGNSLMMGELENNFDPSQRPRRSHRIYRRISSKLKRLRMNALKRHSDSETDQ